MTLPNIDIKKNRLVFIYFCVVAVFFLIILRLLFVVTMGDKGKVRGIYNARRVGVRANIVDRNGILLATDLRTKSLYISSILVRDPTSVARDLSGTFPDLSYSEILRKIVESKGNKSWVLIRRNLTPSQVEKVQNLKQAGLLFEDDRIRVYPQKSLNSHLVGYVDLDRRGLAGIEMQYDRRLMVDERPLQLAMDVRVQDVLHDELLKGMTEFRAAVAAGIVMDVTNGEVLAMVSLPDFDANLQSEATSDQRFNRVTNGTYELGSVCKIFTNTILFENDLVKMTDVFNVRDPIKYGTFTIKDHEAIKDQMTVSEIFSYSSNIGTVHMSKKIGPKKQKEFFQEMGLLKKMDVDFPGLGRPIFPKLWSELSLYTISYGHGIAITPLHLANAVSAIVNGGILHRPSFLKLIEDVGGARVIKESTSETMKQMLRTVAVSGTGRFANIDGYEVGGKTGTAERVDFGKYNKHDSLVSFVGVFPISDPKYLVYVLLDRPNYSFNTGGMIAAPVTGRVIKNIAPILNVMPKTPLVTNP